MDFIAENQKTLYWVVGGAALVTLVGKFAADYRKRNYFPPQSDFKTPAPKSLPNFDVKNTPPILYRPFRHGPNFVTMALRSLSWDEWVEMDSNFIRYHDAKKSELAKGIDKHIAYVDNAQTRLACNEVYEELVLFLTRRYPNVFRLEKNIVSNSLTGERFPYPAEMPTKAMEYAALLIQDDIMLMIKNPDGNYHLDAAAVCLPGFWRLHEKFRTSLDELHQEAKVPHYDEKLKLSMNRYFGKMPAEKPVVRNNYFIQLDDGLFWSHRMGEQEGTEVASWEKANSDGISINDLHFRSERQALRRLPKSGALMFTVRTYFEPMTKIVEEPHVPGRLAEAIRAWTPALNVYKGRAHWDHILMPYLDAKHAEQKASGILDRVPEGEYPF